MNEIIESKNLSQIESVLDQRANNITIISQISISGKELTRIIKMLRIPLRNRDQNYIVRSLWRNYPFTCLATTVYIAIHKYDGNYWDHFGRYLRVPNQGLWKRLFIENIERKGLVVFDRNGVQKYINNILGHAGVPKGNAENFIRDVIIPAVENDMDAYDVYHAIRSESNLIIKTYGLYKGVIDFIKLGDEVSLNLLDRFIKLWKEQQIPFYRHNKGYIPTHLLRELDKYVKENNINTTTKQRKIPIQMPKLKLDPSSLNIYIQFPVIQSNDNAVESVYWIISDKRKENTAAIDTTKVMLSNGVSEFLVEDFQRKYAVYPKGEYEINLYINKRLESSINFNLNDVMLFHSSTNELIIDNSREFKEVYMVISNNLFREKLPIKSQVFSYNMNYSWRSYTLFEIIASYVENININGQIIRLSHKEAFPYLRGNRLNDIEHENFPVYSKAPELIIPKEFSPVLDDSSTWHIKVFSKSQGKIETVPLRNLEKVFTVEGNLIVSLDSLELINKTDFGEFEINLYGPLGSDVTLKFILGSNFKVSVIQNDYQKKQGIKHISMRIPNTFNAEVIWPEYINVMKKISNRFIDYSLTCPDNLYKIVVQFTNLTTGETFPLMIYTKLYDIKITYEGETLFEGDITDKTKFDLENAVLTIDLSNPTLEKYKENNVMIEILNDVKDEERKKFLKRLVRVGSKLSMPLKYFSSTSMQENINLQYRIYPFITSFQPLIFIENDWKLLDFNYYFQDGCLRIFWQQNFPLDNLALYLWKLNKPTKSPIKFNLEINQHELEIPNMDPGYYLLEWMEEEENPFAFLLSDNINKPLFKGNRHQIINLSIDRSLTELALLNDINHVDYEWEKEKLLQILKSIANFGTIFKDYLLEDYDSCCDFGIRNIDSLIDLFTDSNIDNSVKDTILKLSGFQEWDPESLITIVSKELTPNYLKTMKDLNENYFGDINFVKIIADKKPVQLNVLYQQTPFHDPILKGFSLIHTHIEFVKRIKMEVDYFEKVDQLLNEEEQFVNDLYQSLKRSRKFDYRIFAEIERRDYRLRLLSVADYPHLISKIALFNRILSISELLFTDTERIRIRQITKRLIKIDQSWFIHDLIYLSYWYEKIEQRKLEEKERRRSNEYTSFKWKERN